MQTETQGYSHHDEQISTLRGIWQSVILQALLDATTQSLKPCMTKARAEARAWFCLENDDFLEVCSLADMNPHRVMKGAFREIKYTDGKRKNAIHLRKKRAILEEKRIKQSQKHLARKKPAAKRPIFVIP